MDNGTRILLNADGIITDWAKQHFEPVPSPLSIIVNPRTAFNLLTPTSNSHHGFSVQRGIQKLKQYGLEFSGTTGSQTTLKEPGLAGLSFVTVSRLSAIDVFQHVLDYRDLTSGSGHGLIMTFNPTEQRLELRVGWPDGNQGIYYQSGINIIVNKWYVTCSTTSPNRNHKFTLSDGTAITASPTGYPVNVAGGPLMLNVSATGPSMLKGDVGFFGAWDNELTAGDIATVIALSINIMTGRGQTV